MKEKEKMTDRPVCMLESCGRVVTRRNLCHRHYSEDRGIVYVRSSKSPCSCGKPFYAKGKCKTCYMALFRSGLSRDFVEFDSSYGEAFWGWVVTELGVEGKATRKVKF